MALCPRACWATPQVGMAPTITLAQHRTLLPTARLLGQHAYPQFLISSWDDQAAGPKAWRRVLGKSVA